MNKIFLENLLFRGLVPALCGTIIYLLVLMIFGNLNQLGENFFNQELLLCLGITYVVFEVLCLLNGRLEKRFPLSMEPTLTQKEQLKVSTVNWRIFMQFTLGTLIAIGMTTLILSLYFTQAVGYPWGSFEIELITFNLIYFFSSVFYNLMYLNFYFLNQQNQIKLSKEDNKRKELEYQLESFKNIVNPQLLYTNLETLITLIHKDKDVAEEFVDRLSMVYRYMLTNRNNELVELKQELHALENLLYLLNEKYNQNISFNAQVDEEYMSKQIIPGALQLLTEYMVSSTIISNTQPMKLMCYIEEDYLVMEHRLNQRLVPMDKQSNGIQKVIDAYSFYTLKPVLQVKAQEENLVKIPILEVEEDTVLA